MLILALPLTPDGFAPFGQVLMALEEEAHRNEFAARLENYRAHAKLNMAFLLTVSTGPPMVRALERHPFSSQSFIPLDGTRYLVVVCPSTLEGDPDLEKLTAFVAEGTQAISYNPDVWHAPHAVLGGPGKFIMLRWDVGNADDVELRPLKSPIEIQISG